jgi:hypothetical protein
MLVPLETLSGWPQVQNPSVLQTLLLLVGVPLLVFFIVIAINKIVTSVHASRGHDLHANDPLWVGDHDSAALEAASANPGTEASKQVESGDAAVAGDGTGEHVGGAGARW